MKTILYSCVAVLIVWGCTVSQDTTENQAGMEATKALLDSDYEIISRWADPIGNNALNGLGVQGALGAETTGSRINISGNTNYVRKIGDSMVIYLPYYGTRTTGATPLLTDNRSIVYEGVPISYELVPDAKRKRTLITFDLDTPKERYSFLVKVYDNKTVHIDMNAAHSSRIHYEGTIGPYRAIR